MLTRERKSSNYRAKAYTGESRDTRFEGVAEYRYLSDDGDLWELDAWIDEEHYQGRATGGDVEVYVPGIGWVVYND